MSHLCGPFLDGILSEGKTKRERKRYRERDCRINRTLTPHVYFDRPSGLVHNSACSPVSVPPLRPAIVRVVCLVVHHQLIVHKVEAVRLCLIRVQDHLSDCKQTENIAAFRRPAPNLLWSDQNRK